MKERWLSRVLFGRSHNKRDDVSHDADELSVQSLSKRRRNAAISAQTERKLAAARLEEAASKEKRKSPSEGQEMRENKIESYREEIANIVHEFSIDIDQKIKRAADGNSSRIGCPLTPTGHYVYGFHYMSHYFYINQCEIEEALNRIPEYRDLINLCKKQKYSYGVSRNGLSEDRMDPFTGSREGGTYYGEFWIDFSEPKKTWRLFSH